MLKLIIKFHIIVQLVIVLFFVIHHFNFIKIYLIYLIDEYSNAYCFKSYNSADFI